MANGNKSREGSLIRADRSVPGQVTFYDRRVQDAAKARIGTVDAVLIGESLGLGQQDASHPLIKLAVHGATQAILDTSNTLAGDERVAYIAKSIKIVNDGGWPSAPVDETALRERAIDALMKVGFSRDAAVAAVDKK